MIYDNQNASSPEASAHKSNDRIPISAVSEGSRVTVRSIAGGQGFVSRLAALGVMPGASIVVLRNAGGPFLLAVKKSRIAIGRGMANKILVS